MWRREVICDCVDELRRVNGVDAGEEVAGFDVRVFLFLAIIFVGVPIFSIFEEEILYFELVFLKSSLGFGGLDRW